MQRHVPIIAGTYGSGPSSSDHLSMTRWSPMKAANSRGVSSGPAPAQSVLIKFKVPMHSSDFDEALTSINPV